MLNEERNKLAKQFSELSVDTFSKLLDMSEDHGIEYNQLVKSLSESLYRLGALNDD